MRTTSAPGSLRVFEFRNPKPLLEGLLQVDLKPDRPQPPRSLDPAGLGPTRYRSRVALTQKFVFVSGDANSTCRQIIDSRPPHTSTSAQCLLGSALFKPFRSAGFAHDQTARKAIDAFPVPPSNEIKLLRPPSRPRSTRFMSTRMVSWPLRRPRARDLGPRCCWLRGPQLRGLLEVARGPVDCRLQVSNLEDRMGRPEATFLFSPLLNAACHLSPRSRIRLAVSRSTRLPVLCRTPSTNSADAFAVSRSRASRSHCRTSL
jgi:hypothetical protein